MAIPSADTIKIYWEKFSEILADNFKNPKHSGDCNDCTGMWIDLIHPDGTREIIMPKDVSVDNEGNLTLIYNFTPSKDVNALELRYHIHSKHSDITWGKIYNSDGSNVMVANTNYIFALKLKFTDAENNSGGNSGGSTGSGGGNTPTPQKT